MKQTPRTKLTRRELDRLSERVKPLEKDVVGGDFSKGLAGTLDFGAKTCAGKPRNC